jgi:chromosome segregation and condensation protein ScpB
MDTAAKILEIMQAEGQPLNAGKIAELGGLDRKDVDKAMAQLKKEAKIVSPKRCYWAPA